MKQDDQIAALKAEVKRLNIIVSRLRLEVDEADQIARTAVLSLEDALQRLAEHHVN